jgi:bacterioferritin
VDIIAGGHMKGSDKVIHQLDRALSAELTAIVQYMVQAEMCESWGYKQLGARTKARAIEEMRHAERLIERILFLDGKPSVAIPLTPRIGDDPKAQLDLDLRDEIDAIRQYNAAAAVCVSEGDNGTRQLFLKLIEDEEHHTDYLEEQLGLIGRLGLENYLSSQMGGE